MNFKDFIKKNELFEIFNFLNKKEKISIDRNNESKIVVSDSSNNVINTLKSLNDYIKESNPVESLKHDLNANNVSFENFNDKDLTQIIIFFLYKNYPKDIENNLTPSEIKKITKINSIFGMPISDKSLKNNFLESLISKLSVYFSDSEKIKQTVDFIIKHFKKILNSNHVVEIIKHFSENSMPYILKVLYKEELLNVIKAKDLLKLLKERYLENYSSQYFQKLISAYLNADDRFLEEINILEDFVKLYNQENPSTPLDLKDLISKSKRNYYLFKIAKHG